MNRIKLEARSSPGNDLALTPALSPRRGRSNCPIFAIERFARWRQRIGDSTKSGVKAAALHDASDIRTGFMVPMHSKNRKEAPPKPTAWFRLRAGLKTIAGGFVPGQAFKISDLRLRNAESGLHPRRGRTLLRLSLAERAARDGLP